MLDKKRGINTENPARGLKLPGSSSAVEGTNCNNIRKAYFGWNRIDWVSLSEYTLVGSIVVSFHGHFVPSD